MSLIVSALGDNPPRVIQYCTTAKEAWDKPYKQYDGHTLMNKSEKLNSLLNLEVGREKLIEDHVAKTETNFLRLAWMNDIANASMQVTILISSSSNIWEFAAITASFDRMKEKEATWNYILMAPMYEQESRRSQITSIKFMDTDQRTLATSTRIMATRNNTIRKEKITVCFFISDNIGHIPRTREVLKKKHPNSSRHEHQKTRTETGHG